MFANVAYELIGGVLLFTNIVLITLIGRSLVPALYQNLCDLTSSVRSGSLHRRDQVCWQKPS